ncbi:hypothetical protein B0H11DRAFT_2223672 [Mycena galericulata]|nr:hypothetical protein B0H11DRAFT_2223672 [Mycena galericulata]
MQESNLNQFDSVSPWSWNDNAARANSYALGLNNPPPLATSIEDNNSNAVSSWSWNDHSNISFDIFNENLMNLIPRGTSTALSVETLHRRLISVEAALFQLQFKRNSTKTCVDVDPCAPGFSPAANDLTRRNAPTGAPRKVGGPPSHKRGRPSKTETDENPAPASKRSRVLSPGPEQQTLAPQPKKRGRPPKKVQFVYMVVDVLKREGSLQIMTLWWAALRIEWAKTRIRSIRWSEVALLEEEMRRVLLASS